MSDVLRAVVLGIVEGLTEFLPISSTGHMILVEPLLGIPGGHPFWSGTFDIFIQVGAILAVVVYFRRRLWRLGGSSEGTPPHRHLFVRLFVAFVPAALLGLLAGDFIEERLKFPLPVAVAMLTGGAGILVIERVCRRPRVFDAARITFGQALLVGVAQCLSLWPGMSRSASTIMGGLAVGLSTAAAAEFSFFLAIPTMLAAGGYSLIKHLDEVHRGEVVLLGVGFLVSFVVAWVVVAAFMRYIQTHRFTPFAVYRIAAGLVVLSLVGRL